MSLWSVKNGVQRITACELSVGTDPWPFAEKHQLKIDADWAEARSRNRNFFNGVIHLANAVALNDAVFSARLIKTDFKSFLYWRANGFPEAGVLDCFGSALIRSRDGDIILGCQQPGNINSGLAYLPGGFIDARDVDQAGMVHIDDSIAREVAEETGLGSDDVSPEPGYYLTRADTQVSIAVTYRSALRTGDLVEKIRAHIKADPDPELADVVVVRTLADVSGVAMPPYARLLVPSLLNGSAAGTA